MNLKGNTLATTELTTERYGELNLRIKQRTTGLVLDLMEMRDTKLFKLGGFATFREYVESELNRSAEWAYKEIDRQVVCKQLMDAGCDVTELRESHTRELKKIDDDKRVAVFKHASEQGDVSAGSIRSSLAALYPATATCTGCEEERPESDFAGNVLCPDCLGQPEGENPNGAPVSPGVVIDGKCDQVFDDEDPESEAAQLEGEELTNDAAGFSEPSTQGSWDKSPFAEIRQIAMLIDKLSESQFSSFFNEFCQRHMEPDASTQTLRKHWEHAEESERDELLDFLKLEAKPKRSPKKFTKPTVDELLEYADEQDFTHFDAEEFWDFYESKGWIVGRAKMKDWRAAARRWNRENAKKTDNEPLSL